MTRYSFEIHTELTNTDPDTIWQEVVRWECVNRELWPFNMTHPPEYPSVADIPADGRVHFVSQLRLGPIPIDAHHLSLVEREDGTFFDERSSNFMLREWTHRRAVESGKHSVTVRDQCSLVPRLRFAGPALAALYRWIFRRRHRYPRRRFAQ